MTITSYNLTRANDPVTHLDLTIGEKQDPISSQPLNYQRVYLKRLSPYGYAPYLSTYGLLQVGSALLTSVWNYHNAGSWTNSASSPFPQLTNACYERFTSLVRGSETAELLVNLAERREAMNMITNRVVQVFRAFRALRSGRFREFARTLGITRAPSRPRTWRGTLRETGSVWLEHHFGWDPLLSDIFNGIRVIDADFIEDGLFIFEAKAGGRVVVPYSKIGNPAWTEYRESATVTGFGSFQSDIQVDDISLYKANQLGLVNPASVAWELVPLSFLADWLGTIGLWLRSFTDFLGLSLHLPQHVYYIKVNGSVYARYSSNSFGFDYEGFVIRRTRGSIPGPSIALRPIRGLSVTRGVTAIALLTGLFRD